MSQTTDPSDILSRLWEVELEILDVIESICAELNITWFLDSGSALGAARHSGFIPWDDDIDIGMLRKDYERFCAHAPELLPEGFSLHTAHNDLHYSCFFAKIYKDTTRFHTKESLAIGAEMGIFVDVFPYDQVFSDEALQQKQLAKTRRCVKLLHLYHSKHITVPHQGMLGALEKTACYFTHYVVKAIYSRKHLIKAFEDAALAASHERYPGQKELCASLAGSINRVIPCDDLLPVSSLRFENKERPVPGNIESYLSRHYGTWEELPPPEKRKTHLPTEIVFDTTREESYNESESIQGD